MPPRQRLHLFRAIPPRDLMERFLQAAGLLGSHDLRWFSKGELHLEPAVALLPEIEPYYLPCKARRFFYGRGDPDAALLVTVIRHLLSEYEHELAVTERVGPDGKQTLYQIQPVRSYKDLSGVSLQVDFL